MFFVPCVLLAAMRRIQEWPHKAQNAQNMHMRVQVECWIVVYSLHDLLRTSNRKRKIVIRCTRKKTKEKSSGRIGAETAKGRLPVCSSLLSCGSCLSWSRMFCGFVPLREAMHFQSEAHRAHKAQRKCWLRLCCAMPFVVAGHSAAPVVFPGASFACFAVQKQNRAWASCPCTAA